MEAENLVGSSLFRCRLVFTLVGEVSPFFGEVHLAFCFGMVEFGAAIAPKGINWGDVLVGRRCVLGAN